MDFASENYHLTFPEDRPYVYLDSKNGAHLADLFVLSSVHTLHGRDDTTGIGSWEIEYRPGVTIFTLRAQSSCWRSKTIRLRCTSYRFTYEIEVEGHGMLSEASYLGGYYSGNLRWGSGFFRSGQNFECGFNPEPNTSELTHFHASSCSTIDLLGVPLPGRDSWFFTPPPFCFALKQGPTWLGVGIEAAPGENQFSDYTYNGTHGAFHLTLSYDGMVQVCGKYQLPSLGFDFCADEYETLAAHRKALVEARYVPVKAHPSQPSWWKRPIFCGWGSQCYAASVRKGRAPDFARQDLYESFVGSLERHKIQPGTIVIDDKWQSSYGENHVNARKWPDLQGFIGCQHSKGSKVLLWLKAWDPEGLSPDMCITNSAGAPLAVDPTNPVYESRLRESVRRMISSRGYDADGFKIDFTARIPSGPSVCTFGSLWGLELMKRYLSIISTEAKAAKPDALIMTHTPNPYLGDVVDMVRLNDINTGKDIPSAMIHRAKVVRAALPDTLIDTDNWPMPDKESWKRYTCLQPELGIPSLYFATHIDSTGEPLEDEDYQLVRDTWNAYLSREDLFGSS